MAKHQHDWNKIMTEYITTGISYRALAKRLDVSLSAVNKHAKLEHWKDKRDQYRQKVTQKVIQTKQQKTIDTLSRFDLVTEKLLSKIEKAVEECDITIVENVKKVKTVDYKEDDDGNSSPVVVETTTKDKQCKRLCIDKAGLKQITAALKDIKEIRNIKSKADEEEQKMRISLLKKQVDGDKIDTQINVSLSSDLDKFKV